MKHKEFRITVQGFVGMWQVFELNTYLKACWKVAEAGFSFVVEFRESA